MHVLTTHTHTHTHTHIHTLHPRGWGCKKEGVEGCRRLKLLVYAAFSYNWRVAECKESKYLCSRSCKCSRYRH
jgi:hypothetical protein